MTLQEIKELFGVDLIFKSRKAHLVYLRGHYIDQEYLKGRPYLEICKELKCNHATAFHYLQRKPMYQKIKEYNKLKKAFDNKDAELYKEIEDSLLGKSYITYGGIETKKTTKKEKMPMVRWSHTKIIEALRKDTTHPLWEKPMKKFTIEDYEILEKILKQ